MSLQKQLFSYRCYLSVGFLLVLLGCGGQVLAAEDWINPVVKSIPTFKRYEGLLQPKEYAFLRAQVAGQVDSVSVHSGQQIEAGGVILQLDARVVEQKLITAEAHYRSAVAARQLASLEFEQQQKLYQQQHSGLTELKRREAALTLADANRAVAHAEVEAIRVQRQYYTIRAPYAGVIGTISVKTGDWVEPGGALAEFYQDRVWQVLITVPENEALVLASANPQDMVVTLPVSEGAGQVKVESVTLVPSLLNSSRSRTLEINLAVLPVQLLPDMQANVEVPKTLFGADAEVTQSLWLPRDSVIERGGVTAVLLLQEDRAVSMRYVRLGRERDGWVEILAGLAAADKVLIHSEHVGGY